MMQSVERVHGSVWADLVLYAAFAFCVGLAVGLSAALASRPIGHETNWGSWADWVAALGALVAAVSTIAIAVIGQKAVANRRRVSLQMAVALVQAPVVADMEIAVRVSRHWQALKDETLVKFAEDLYLHAIPKDDGSIGGLPPAVLSSLLSAMSLLAVLKRSAKSLQNGSTERRRQNVAMHFERIAGRLRPAADYLTRDRVEEMPWSDWIPKIDAKQGNARLMARYHSVSDGIAQK